MLRVKLQNLLQLISSFWNQLFIENSAFFSLDYGYGLILCMLLPGKEYKGNAFNKPAGYDSKLVAPDNSGKPSMLPFTIGSNQPSVD